MVASTVKPERISEITMTCFLVVRQQHGFESDGKIDNAVGARLTGHAQYEAMKRKVIRGLGFENANAVK